MTNNNTIIRNAMAMVNRVQDCTKPNTDGYVTNKELISFLAENTGLVYGKSKTRAFLIGKLDEFMMSIIPQTEEQVEEYKQEIDAQEIPESVDAPLDDSIEAVADTTEAAVDKWSVDYWWNRNCATHILDRVLENAARKENTRKDVIAFHMVRSFVFEMIFGKRLVEFIDNKRVENFSKEKTPREWALVRDFCNKFYDRYLHKCYTKKGVVSKDSACIGSEAMCYKYRKVRYAIDIPAETQMVRVVYELDWATKKMVCLNNGKTFDLDTAAFKKIDETCGLIR